MNTDTAIALIEQLVYKPGWVFTAADNTRRFEGSIKLAIDYPAVDSNRDRAPLGYPATEPASRFIETTGEEVAAGTPTIRPDGKARASFTLLACDFRDDVALWHAITEKIMLVEEHEMREFLRVCPTYHAPFHPHRAD